MCQVQHSRSVTSVSALSSNFLTHVGTPDISTLHTVEPAFSSTRPHRCRRPGGRGEPNPLLSGCNLVSTTTPAHHNQRQYTGEASAPHTQGTCTKNEVPCSFGIFNYDSFVSFRVIVAIWVILELTSELVRLLFWTLCLVPYPVGPIIKT